MNNHEALQLLNDREGRKPSEIGEAVDVLFNEHGSYSHTPRPTGVSLDFLSLHRRIYQLPRGIRWKVDEGIITTGQAYQISRVVNDEDKWLLAITIVEKSLRSSECENVVNNVLNNNLSMRDALSVVTGVRFAEISPPPLFLPISVDFWFTMTRLAWDNQQDWQDFCYQSIKQGMDVSLKDAASKLEAIAASLREAGEATRD